MKSIRSRSLVAVKEAPRRRGSVAASRHHKVDSRSDSRWPVAIFVSQKKEWADGRTLFDNHVATFLPLPFLLLFSPLSFHLRTSNSVKLQCSSLPGLIWGGKRSRRPPQGPLRRPQVGSRRPENVLHVTLLILLYVCFKACSS